MPASLREARPGRRCFSSGDARGAPGCLGACQAITGAGRAAITGAGGGLRAHPRLGPTCAQVPPPPPPRCRCDAGQASSRGCSLSQGRTCRGVCPGALETPPTRRRCCQASAGAMVSEFIFFSDPCTTMKSEETACSLYEPAKTR